MSTHNFYRGFDPKTYRSITSNLYDKVKFSSVFIKGNAHHDVLWSGEPCDVTVLPDGRFQCVNGMFGNGVATADWFIGVPSFKGHDKALHVPFFYDYWACYQPKPVNMTSPRIYGISAVMGTRDHHVNSAARRKFIHELSLHMPVFLNSRLRKDAPTWSKAQYVDVPLGIDNHAIRQHKYDFISRYTHHFCFENRIYDGYLTEKPHDAIMCGCIPVYQGSPDVGDWIDGSVMVNCNGKSLPDVLPSILDYKERRQRLLEAGTSVYKVSLEEMLQRYSDFEKRILSSVNRK